MQSSLALFQSFIQSEQYRENLQLSPALEATLEYCEYLIRQQFDKNDKVKYKTKNRKKDITEEYRDAIKTLDREEKVRYYIRIVSYIKLFQKNIYQPPKTLDNFLSGEGFSRSFHLNIWKKKLLKLDRERHYLYAERQKKIKNYDLGNYLLRMSKNKEFYSFVLQAINDKPHVKSRTVHIGFDSLKKFEEWTDSIRVSIEFKQWEWTKTLFQNANRLGSRAMSSKGLIYNGELSYNLDMMSKSAVQGLNSDKQPAVFFQNEKKKFIEDMTEYKSKNQRKIKVQQSENRQNQIKRQNQFNRQNQIKRQQLKRQESSPDKRQKQKLQTQIQKYEEQKALKHINSKTIVDDIIDGEDEFGEPQVFQQKIQQENEESIKTKKHLDLFHKIYPEYELADLQNVDGYEEYHKEDSFRLLKHTLLQKKVKMIIQFDKKDFSKQKIICLITNPSGLANLNENIQEVQIKTYISSENSAIMYQVNHAYNRLYRPRDFVFIRHVFNDADKLYMIDKSVQNTNYPPFLTIVRGELCIVWGIFEKEDKLVLFADVQVANQGYLNAVQELSLTTKLLKGYSKIKELKDEVSYKLFDLTWDITKNESNKIDNQIRLRRMTIQKIQKKYSHPQEQPHQIQSNQLSPLSFSKKQDAYYDSAHSEQKIPQTKEVQSPIKSEKTAELKTELRKFEKKTMEQIGQINLQQISKEQKLKTQLSVKRTIGKDGMVIISNEFTHHKYQTQPSKSCKKVFWQQGNEHPIWKGDWTHDDKEGAIVFINKKKIQDQKGVLKFILTKIGKNLLSGKSVLNISLPVDIFAAESNLERLIIGMSYAPILLQNLNGVNQLTKLKRCIAFGITNSVLYLNMQKPFNPILGETFQCWINGCPAYAQQISHHPPIGAILLKGRGFEITAQLESKVEVHMNSGCGTNDGIYRVRFVDGCQICFITPGGQVSGLAYGDRKFNIVGKSYYWITNTNIMIQVVFDPAKKGFFSVGKAEKPSDYFQGNIYQTKPEFMANFLNGKRKEPGQKDRVQDLGRVSGIWNKYVKFQNEELLNFNRDFPLKLQYQSCPLPSDANWREDIEYRRIRQTTRAQTEKERLEVLQRKDRKLREKGQKVHKK